MQLQRQVVDVMSASVVDADHIAGRLALLLRQLLDTAPTSADPAGPEGGMGPGVNAAGGQVPAPRSSVPEGADWRFGVHVDTAPAPRLHHQPHNPPQPPPPPSAHSLQAMMNPAPGSAHGLGNVSNAPTGPGTMIMPLSNSNSQHPTSHAHSNGMAGPGPGPGPEHATGMNFNVHANNPQFDFLSDPATQNAVGDFAGMAQTSVEQDQLLSNFFGPPDQAGNALLATLWNHDVFDEFNDFFESTGLDMGRT